MYKIYIICIIHVIYISNIYKYIYIYIYIYLFNTRTHTHTDIYIYIYIYMYIYINLYCELLHKKCSILKIELYKPETDK